MKVVSFILATLLCSSVFAQSSTPNACGNNFSQSTCISPCVFTPAANSAVCSSKCSLTQDLTACAAQASCNVLPDKCVLKQTNCSSVSGPNISSTDCGANCSYTAAKTSCTPADNLTTTCNGLANNYSGCNGNTKCKFTTTTPSCGANANYQCVAATCDATYCVQCSIDNSKDDCTKQADQPTCEAFNQCKWDATTKCTNNCASVTDATKCPSNCIACTPNKTELGNFCSKKTSDALCSQASTQCSVTSTGTCAVDSTLCLVGSAKAQCDTTNCQFKQTVDPTCQNQTCSTTYAAGCDTFCTAVKGSCVTNGNSNCGAAQTSNDCSTATFCSFSQGGTCSALSDGSSSSSSSALLAFALGTGAAALLI